jgi:hypothetical protein
MQTHNICTCVDNRNVREVWIWAYQAGGPPNQSLESDESKISNQFGEDVSNSGNVKNDMPKCNNAYRVYTYSYHPSLGMFHVF